MPHLYAKSGVNMGHLLFDGYNVPAEELWPNRAGIS